MSRGSATSRSSSSVPNGEGNHVRAAMAYELDGRRWLQEFEAVLLDDEALARVLERSGLAFDHWVDRGRGWLAAVPLA